MEKLTKEELRRPDLVTETMGKAAQWVAGNAKLVKIAAALVFAVCLGWVAVIAVLEKKETKAQNALFPAEASLHELQDSYKAGEPPATPEAAKKAPDAKAKKATGNLMADYKEPFEQLQSVVKQFPGTTAAGMAALDLGKLYFDHKMYDEQIGILENSLKDGKSGLIKALALNLLGVGYDAKGDCNKAIEKWQQIESNKDMRFLAAQSALKEGACFEKLNQPDKAQASYERVLKDYKDDQQAVSLAKKFLRSIKKGNS